MNQFHILIHNQIFQYLFWGIITTLLYFIIRLSMIIEAIEPMISASVAEIVSIIFAFLVNKYLVFNKNNQRKSSFNQLITFLAGRFIAALFDVLVTYLFIKRFYYISIKFLSLNRIDLFFVFHISLFKKLAGSPYLLNETFWTFIIQVIIIFFNYIISKYFAFN